MAYTTINKSTVHFNTKLYSGDGGTQSVTGVGFQPDWTWLKSRSAGYNHRLFNAVRGAGKNTASNLNDAEQTVDEGVTAFNTDGFSVKQGGVLETNNSSHTYVSWNWKANGQGSANTDGSINTTYTSVNTTAGFSISTYTGTGSNATVGHGLGAKPDLMIVKNLGATENWMVYHKELDTSAPEDYYVLLNSNAGRVNEATVWNDTAPTSSVFSIGTHAATNQSGNAHIAYCFTEKTGYSKFGLYTANNNADGPFIYLGFKPAFVIFKILGSSGNFHMYDNKRTTSNTSTSPWRLRAETTAVEAQDTNDKIDFVSNGIKIKSNGVSINNHTGSVIYWAFAEAPLVGSNNIPATAR